MGAAERGAAAVSGGGFWDAVARDADRGGPPAGKFRPIPQRPDDIILCPRCKVEGPRENFAVSKTVRSKRTGRVMNYTGWCKPCRAEYSRDAYRAGRWKKTPPKKKHDPTDDDRDCFLCGKRKPAGEFSVDRCRRGGRRYDCRACYGAVYTKTRGFPPAERKRLMDAIRADIKRGRAGP